MQYEEKKYYINFLFSITLVICIVGIFLFLVSHSSTAYIHTPDTSKITSNYYPIGAVMPTADNVYFSVSNPYYGTFMGYDIGELPGCPSGISTTNGAKSVFSTASMNLNSSSCNTHAFTEDASYYYFIGNLTVLYNNTNTVEGIIRYSKADNSLDTSFNPLGNLESQVDLYQLTNGLNDALIEGNYLYIAGSYQFTYNSVQFQTLMRIDLTTKQLDQTWNPSTVFTPNYGYPFSIASDGTYLYIGGMFDKINGTTRNGLGRVLISTGALDAWDPNPGAYTQTRNIRIDGGYAYVVSNKSTIAYASNPAVTNAIIVRFNTTTGAMDEAWSTTAKANFSSKYLYALEVTADHIYVGGGGGGTPVINRLNKVDGTLDATWNTALTFSRAPYVGGGEITAIAINADGVFVYGDFLNVNGLERLALAKLSLTDRALDTSWASAGIIFGTNQQLKLTIFGNTLFHGDISAFNATSTGAVRRFNRNTLTVDTSWNPVVVPDKSNITAMAKDNTYVYMGGLVQSFDGEAVTQLLRINAATGNIDATFKPNIPLTVFSDATPTTHEVTALHISGNYLYVGGTYTSSVTSTYQGYAIRIDLTTNTIDANWGPVATDDAVLVFSVTDSYVYMAGWFYAPLTGILRANLTDGVVDSTWDLGLNEALNTMVISGDYAYIATDWGLTQVLGQAVTGFAKVQISTKSLVSYPLTIDSSQGIMSMLPMNDSLCLFGYFSSINSQKSNGFTCVDMATATITYNRLNISGYVEHTPEIFDNTIYLIEDNHIGAMDLLFNVSGIPAGLDVVTGATNIEQGSSTGAFGYIPVGIYKGSTPIATAQVHMGPDRNWSTVTADVDVTTKKAFISGLGTAPGVTSYSIYIPKGTGDNTVYICPNATSLASVTTSCANGSTFTNGQTKNITFPSGTAAVTVTQETISGTVYWRADGVLGTGGISYYVAPITPTPTATATPTPTITETVTPTPTSTPTSTPTISQTGNFLDVDISNEQNQGQTCPIFTDITDSPLYIKTGDSGTLSWKTTGATIVRIFGMNDIYGANSSAVVSPTETITYTIIAENDTCSTPKKVEVRVATYLPTEVHTATVATLLVLETISATTQSTGVLGNIWLSLASFVDRRKRRYSGMVYDSKTKKPVPRAVVRLISAETKEIVDTVVTDAQGVFKLMPSQGRFVITVSHPQYSFPTKNKIAVDDKTTNKVYLGEEIVVSDKKEVLLFSIPIDPTEITEGDLLKLRFKSFFTAFMLVGSFATLLSGLLYSIYATLQNPQTENITILLLFLVIAGYKYLSFYCNSQRMGKAMYQNEPIANLEIGLFDPEFGTLQYRAFTDTEGQYLFIVPAENTYILKVLDTKYSLALEGKPMESLTIEGQKTKNDTALIASKLEIIDKS